MAKKNQFIAIELDWAEKQLAAWKEYVDKNPVHLLQDRTVQKGRTTVIAATIEQQGKFLQETLKNYLSLLEVVEKLREKEAAKQAYADRDVPERMKKI
jgi:hypothetical protein